MFSLIRIANPNFVAIGADSKAHDLPEPCKGKTLTLIKMIRSLGIEVKIKDNLSRLMK
jgi:hypothetical protein